MKERFWRVVERVSSTTGGEGPRRFDWALVGVLGLLLLTELILRPVFDDRDLWLTLALAGVASIAAVPWRRVRPFLLLAPFLAQFAVDMVALLSDVENDQTGAAFFSGVLCLYAAARWLRVRQAALIFFIAWALTATGELLNDGITVWRDVVIAGPIAFALVAALATVARYRAGLLQQRIEEVRLRERQELARELHDVVAHHVSAIAVQAQAGGAVADANPAAAREVLATIETSASVALSEMRQMVGILRSDDNRQPHASLTSLRELATDGPPKVAVDIDVDGELPSAVLATLFRIAQESITNARRHGVGVETITVHLRVDDGRAHLEVLDDGEVVAHRGTDGYGRIGMTERAEALSGTLESEPHPGGGWRVRAQLPVDGARA